MSGFLSIVKEEEGFTLAELLVYVAILAVILGGIYTLYDGSERIYSAASGQADAQRSGRLAQMNMTKHLRMTESIVTADDYAVTFRADIDDDNLWDEVSYYIENERLYIKVNNGSAIELTSGVRNEVLGKPLFVYYDLHGAVIDDEASRKTKTYQLGIDLVIDTDITRPPEAYTLSSKVKFRNYN